MLLPFYVACLGQIHKNHEADEDERDVPLDENSEHLDVVDEVEGLPVIQQAAIDCGSFLHELVDELHSHVCAQGGRTSCLKTKLVCVGGEFLINDDENDPVEDL